MLCCGRPHVAKAMLGFRASPSIKIYYLKLHDYYGHTTYSFCMTKDNHSCYHQYIN